MIGKGACNPIHSSNAGEGGERKGKAEEQYLIT